MTPLMLKVAIFMARAFVRQDHAASDASRVPPTAFSKAISNATAAFLSAPAVSQGQRIDGALEVRTTGFGRAIQHVVDVDEFAKRV